jgi:hypothetical protein
MHPTAALSLAILSLASAALARDWVVNSDEIIEAVEKLIASGEPCVRDKYINFMGDDGAGTKTFRIVCETSDGGEVMYRVVVVNRGKATVSLWKD